MIKIGGVNVAPRSSKSCCIIPASAGLLSRAFLKSSPRQSNCGEGRQRIRWLAETYPESRGAAPRARELCRRAKSKPRRFLLAY
jgi:hypothetical protein